MTTKPPDVEIEESRAESSTQQGDPLAVEDLAAAVRKLPVRIVPLGVVLVGLVMSWVSVSVPLLGIHESVTGYDTDAGKFALLVVGLILATEGLGLDGRYVRGAWVGGGVAMTISLVLTYFNFWTAFEEVRGMMEEEGVAGSIEMGFDPGIYLTVFAALVITVVGLQMRSDTVEPIRDRFSL